MQRCSPDVQMYRCTDSEDMSRSWHDKAVSLCTSQSSRFLEPLCIHCGITNQLTNDESNSQSLARRRQGMTRPLCLLRSALLQSALLQSALLSFSGPEHPDAVKCSETPPVLVPSLGSIIHISKEVDIGRIRRQTIGTRARCDAGV